MIKYDNNNFKLFLAPMEDITSNAFRTLCYRLGADITFTELTRVEGLARGNKSTWSRVLLKDDTPTIIQLLGAKDVFFKKFLNTFEPSEGFKGFSLNMGCPSPDVIKLGQGCAMIRRISKTRKIIKIFNDYGFKLSVKIRLGLNQKDKDMKVYLNLINEVDADFFVVHARYGLQTYNTPADNSVYEDCVKTGKKIIANGDITSVEQIEHLKSIGVAGVMIGRAAVNFPAIFKRLKNEPTPDVESIRKEYMQLAEKYCEPFRYRNNFFKHFKS
ncbi:MAG: tRNA-dihydrouridine synthase family protein [Nanoarchaeota archaeon]|nr:tRNA-dihydrouridine synthase family protein [Nanoarchaeota archaeon]